MLARILDLIDLLSRWAGAVAVVLVCGIAVLVVTEVVSRWLFGTSLSFAWEYAAYFFAVSIFCGAAYTMRTGGHVRVALFRGLLNDRGNHVMDIVATLVGIGVAAFAAYSMILFAWQSFVRGSVSPTIDATPLVIPQAAVAFGLTLFALQLLARLVRLLRGEAPEDLAAKEEFGVD